MILCNNNSHKHNDYFFFVVVIVIEFSHKSELVILIEDQMTAFFLNTPITRIIIYIQIIVFFIIITMYCSWVIIASCYLFSTAQLLFDLFL